MRVPVWGLALLAVGVPLGAPVLLGASAPPFGLAEAGAGLAAAGWALQTALRRRLTLAGLAIWIPLGLLVAVALCSAAGAQDLGLALKETAKWLLFGVGVTM